MRKRAARPPACPARSPDGTRRSSSACRRGELHETGRIGVVGAGVIGRGVAQCCASSGLPVLLVDLSDDILAAALGYIAREGRRLRLLARSPAPAGGAPTGVIATSTDYAQLADCGVIVENVTEDPDCKAESYRLIERYCPDDALLVANTSIIPITRIGSWLARPERLVGIHFMNPVPLTSSVELIRGFHTSPAALDAAKRFLGALGKNYIVEEDSAGFVSNRVLMLAVNEAAFLVQEGVADARNVDRVFVECFGHPMGMLETADLIGLDTVLRSIELLHQFYGDDKFRPCPLLRKMVDAGLLGRKSGEGFFSYRGGTE